MKIHVHILLTFGAILFSCSTPTKNVAELALVTDAPTEVKKADRKTILFFGDSITAGYQLDINQAFPALIQDRLDSLGYDYQVVNAGLSGETTAGGKNRIDWVLSTVPDIFFLELGANDGLRGLQLDESRKNLQSIIDAVKMANPEVKIILAGMQVPPNLGQDYTSTFRKLFPDLASSNEATLIPFILEGVAGIPDLNLEDGIHPTPDGHGILAETVWIYLNPLITKPT
jgi:acyl-CoA thioesterase-1